MLAEIFGVEGIVAAPCYLPVCSVGCNTQARTQLGLCEEPNSQGVWRKGSTHYLERSGRRDSSPSFPSSLENFVGCVVTVGPGKPTLAVTRSRRLRAAARTVV